MQLNTDGAPARYGARARLRLLRFAGRAKAKAGSELAVDAFLIAIADLAGGAGRGPSPQ